MSWFVLIQSERQVLNSQDYWQAVLSGEFIGEYAFDNLFERIPLYFRVQEAVSTFFSAALTPPIDRHSKLLTEKILARVIQGKSFHELFPELFNQPEEIENKSPSKTSEKQEIGGRKEFVHYLFDEFIQKEKNALNKLEMALNKGDEAVKGVIKKALVAGLTPLCSEGAKIGFQTLIKTAINNFMDSTIKSGLSILAITIIYKLAQEIIHFSAEACKGSLFDRIITLLNTRFPSSSTMLWVLTALHIGKMVQIFWKVEHLRVNSTDSDKEKVKALAVRLTKEPIEKILESTNTYKALQLVFQKQKIEDFVTLLINEMVDHYWVKLHKVRFLNLPLVS